MGLAGRKQKQRIPADPRNLSWADDASRFGLSYLSKFGWDASQGLGSSGDGMKSHIKVQQKLDTMGIGAQHQRDPNGIAWKQNKEFEALLKKLNQSVELKKGGEDTQGEGKKMMNETFVRAQEETVEGKSVNESSATTTKRKREEGDDLDASKNTGKKQRKDKKEKHQKPSPDDAIHTTPESSSAITSSKSHFEPTSKPHSMAHRARIRAAKRIAGKSASAIAEILGIAPSASVYPSTSTPSPTPPSLSPPASQPCISLDNLTISTKSVADYFKEKLTARPSSSSSPTESSKPSGSATPCLDTTGPAPGFSPDDNAELSRKGIGRQAPTVPPQVPEAGVIPAGRDSNVDGLDAMTEKQRRKAERKAEKRKQREAKTNQATPDVVSNLANDKVVRVQGPSKRERKQKKRYEGKEQLFTPWSNGKDAANPEFERKSKLQRKDER